MRAKEFLCQVYKLDCIINNKMAEKRQWYEMVTGTASQMGGDRVQSSSNPQRMSDAIARYMDIEREINDKIDELIALKRDVNGVIELLSANEYDVLHMRYIQGYTFQEIANIKERSYSCITTIHGAALRKVQQIIDARDKQHASD